MGIQNIKVGDTLPVLRATLKNPDGSLHDLTGKTVKLNIHLSDGTRLQRDMVVDPDADGAADPTLAIVGYDWVATDWDAASGGTGTRDDPHTVGGLVASPEKINVATPDHRMEYEALGPGADDRVTFPNDSRDNDTLHVSDDVAQG